MSQVTVVIDNKQYRMACDEGQEDHLTQLGEQFDRYVGHLKQSFGEIGDGRLMVMAGIMVMDEMSELQRKIGGLEAEMDALRQNHDDAASLTHQNENALAIALQRLAERMETLSDRLMEAK